jgi:WD40 repeat protein
MNLIWRHGFDRKRTLKKKIIIALLLFIFMLTASGYADEGGEACSPVYAHDEGPSFERLHEIELPPEWAMLPKFSPDGKWLAYKSLPEGHDSKPISGFVTNIAGAHIHIVRADLPCPDSFGNKCEGGDEDITPFIDEAGKDEAPTLGASFPSFSPDS